MNRPLDRQIRPQFFLEEDAGGGSGGVAVAEPPKSWASKLSENLAEEREAAAVPEIKEAAPVAKPIEQKPAAKKPVVPPSAVPAEVLKVEAPAKTPEKPAVIKEEVFDSEALSKDMSPKGRENFKRQEAHYKGLITKAETDLAEAKKAVEARVPSEEAAKLRTDFETLKAERDALKAEHAEMSKTMELIAVERSPQFQAKYVRERAAILDSAAKRVDRAGGNSAAFKAALQLEGAERYTKIEEAMGEIPQFVQNQVASEVAKLETLDEERAAALKNAGSVREQWAEEQTAAQKQQETEVIKARQTRFSEVIPALAQPPEGSQVPACILAKKLDPSHEKAAAWNGDIDAIEQKAKALLFNGTDFNEFAAAAYKASAYDKMQALFVQVANQNEQFRQQIAELTGGEPGGSNGAGGGGPAPASGDDKLTFAEKVSRGIAQSNSGG